MDDLQVFSALANHPEFTPFIELNPLVETKAKSLLQLSEEEQRTLRFQALTRLTNYYNYVLIVSHPKQMHEARALFDTTGLKPAYYNFILWIENEIHRLRMKYHEITCKFLNDFIEFIEHLPLKINDFMYITINEAELFNYIEGENNQIKCLQSLHLEMIQKYEKYISRNQNHLLKELKGIFIKLCSFIEPKTAYYEPNPLEDRAEEIIMSHALPFYKDIQSIIDAFPNSKPQDIMKSIFNLEVKISSMMQTEDSCISAVIVLFLYRVIFSHSYPFLEGFHQNQIVYSISLKNVLLDNLAIPNLFLPDHDPSLTPRKVLSTDPLYSLAIKELESLPLYTNPLDLIGVVNHTLLIIEKGATWYSHGDVPVFPFEVTFGLYLAVLISADIPSYKFISELVDAYSPENGLCPKFEFSRAKIIASNLQCEDMIEQEKEKR